jgi:predicted nucleic acid-binding protein
VTTKDVFFWDLALKMEAAVLSETLVVSYETIRLYIPEDSIVDEQGERIQEKKP